VPRIGFNDVETQAAIRRAYMAGIRRHWPILLVLVGGGLVLTLTTGIDQGVGTGITVFVTCMFMGQWARIERRKGERSARRT